MANSGKTGLFWTLSSLLVLAAVIYFVGERDLVEMVRSYIRSDLLTVNAKLRTENEKLKEAIEGLVKQNHRLKKALVGRTIQFSMLNEAAMEPLRSSINHSQDPVENLDKESFLI